MVLGGTTPAPAAETLPLRSLDIVNSARDGNAVSAGRTTEAKLLNFVPPRAQPADAAAGAYGTVVVEVDINEIGKLTKLSVIKTSGYRSLDGRALHALRNAKYEAATVAGRPVAGTYAVDVGLDVDE